MIKRYLMLSLLAVCALLTATAKKPLDHDAFDSWRSVRVSALSNNGQWAAYMVNPQEGDGVLTLRNTSNGKEINIPRGYQPSFSANSLWAAALVKPMFADTRQAKIKKKKGFDLPQDSLAIVNLKTGKVQMVPNVINYRIGKEGGEWLVYTSCDTALIKPKALKDSKAGRPLVALHLPSGNRKIVNWTKQWSLSRNGMNVGMEIRPQKSDTLACSGMAVLTLGDTTLTLLDREKKFYGAPVFSYNSDQMAYTASNDSNDTGTRRASLYRVDMRKPGVPEATQYYVDRVPNPEFHLMRPPTGDDPQKNDSILKVWADAQRQAQGDSLFVNQYSIPVFSRDGKRLIIGVAPVIAPNDTSIVDFEQAALDIWRWDAPYTPPQEARLRDDMRKHTFPVVIDLESGKQQLLTYDP